MSNDEKIVQGLDILDKAAHEIGKLGFDNVTVSEMFFAYGIRIGALACGARVFADARLVIDNMEKQSRG